MTIEIKNAVIESTRLGYDHGFLSAWVFLDYGGAGQGFGGYALMSLEGSPYREKSEQGPSYAGVFIDSILDVVGVEQWEDLKGKSVRVKASLTNVEAIGHFIKDKWFSPREKFESMKACDNA